MNADHNALAQITQTGRNAVAAVRAALLWFVGVPADAILAHRMDVQMRYTGAGLLVCIWYVFMLVTWVKTGLYFFGTAGGAAFALIPTMMLAVDRMIVSQPRNPRGALASYAIDGLLPNRWEFALRSLAALSFSVVTTAVFLINHSGAEIHARQQRDQQASNAPLRAEIAARIDSQIGERTRSVTKRSAELEAQAVILREDYAASRKLAEVAEERMHGAQFNVAAELGGIAGRASGPGVRHDAYQMIARQSQDAGVNARARETRSREALAKVQAELQQLNADRERIAADRAGAMGNIEADMQEDARYVKRKRGLFAEASTLIKLYGDSDVGPGLVLVTFIAAVFLFVLEMSPLLGLAFLSTTPFDVERIAQDRSAAAGILAHHEMELVQAAARRSVRVRPATAAESGGAPAAQADPEHAPGTPAAREKGEA